MRYILGLIILLGSTQISSASESLSLAKIIKRPNLAWPVNCQINQDCWIYNYVDMISGDDIAADLTCNHRTYDAHKGTDIGIKNLDAFDKGVDVLATADGTIKRLRDGESDFLKDDQAIEEIKKQRKECGNAVLIDHGEGLETIYCHLKKGSISVKKGQRIKAGDKIAQIGLSGMTEFPHLHFGVLLNGKIIDPFTGLDNTQECGKRKNRLWDKSVTAQYEPLILNQAGFNSEIIKINEIYEQQSHKETLSTNSERLIFWFSYLGAQKGDSINIEILDPNLKPWLTQEITQNNKRARQFYYVGKNTRDKNLVPGAYMATVTIKRINNKGQDISENIKQTVTVLPE